MELKLVNSDKVALISDTDADLASYRWYLKHSQWCDYVCRSVRIGDRVRTERLHRVIAERMFGTLPRRTDVHHGPDENTLNNTRENLGLLEHDYHGWFTRQQN